MTDQAPDREKIEKMMRLVADLERAISALGKAAAEAANGERDAAVGGVLGAAVGIIAQTYGVDVVKEQLTKFVIGRESEAFWALQRGLVQSEEEQQGEGLARIPSAPGSVPSAG